MSLTYSTRANLKVKEDAKNFGIKIKNGLFSKDAYKEKPLFIWLDQSAISV